MTDPLAYRLAESTLRALMLAVRDLCLERHFQPVFQPLSFDLVAGELLVVTGPNGSGKTTLIRLLAGLLEPTSGMIARATREIHYVGHDTAVKAELSVRENLRFYARLAVAAAAVESAIAGLDLVRCAEQAGRTLSAGQRKRAALARLITVKFKLWLLDEPYTNLDASGIDLMDAILSDHLSAGGACVMATHGPHRPAPAGLGERWQLKEVALAAGAIAA